MKTRYLLLHLFSATLQLFYECFSVDVATVRALFYSRVVEKLGIQSDGVHTYRVRMPERRYRLSASSFPKLFNSVLAVFCVKSRVHMETASHIFHEAEHNPRRDAGLLPPATT